MPQSSTKSFSGIFISYRRNDCPAHAGRLNDKLVEHFGYDQVFMDVDSIGPGEDFIEVIERELDSCAILLAMIGCDWMTGGSDQNLLQNANDYVRLEIATALRRNIRVVPILVEGAAMPKFEDLPDDMAKLLRRNAVELSDLRWSRDVAELISSLEPIVGGKQAGSSIPRARSHLGRATVEPKRFRTIFIIVAVAVVLLLVLLIGTRMFSDGGPSGDDPTPISSPTIGPTLEPTVGPTIQPRRLSAEENAARGRELHNQRKYFESEPYWRAAVEQDQFNGEYNNQLGVALFFQGRYIDAEPFLRKAVVVNSGNAQYKVDVGNVLERQAKYADAEPFHREAVQLMPNIAGYWNELGVDLYFQNKLPEAEVSFRKAINLGSTDPEVFNNLGNTLSKLGQHAEARTQFQEAVRRDPNNQSFRDNLKKEQQSIEGLR